MFFTHGTKINNAAQGFKIRNTFTLTSPAASQAELLSYFVVTLPV